MLDFDFGLGDDIDMLRETVASFAAEQIAPRASEIDRENQFPRDLWPKLGELGLLGITVEEDLGGSQLGYLAHVVAMAGAPMDRKPATCRSSSAASTSARWR